MRSLMSRQSLSVYRLSFGVSHSDGLLEVARDSSEDGAAETREGPSTER